jgi:hypothetical protein
MELWAALCTYMHDACWRARGRAAPRLASQAALGRTDGLVTNARHSESVGSGPGPVVGGGQ